MSTAALAFWCVFYTSFLASAAFLCVAVFNAITSHNHDDNDP